MVYRANREVGLGFPELVCLLMGTEIQLIDHIPGVVEGGQGGSENEGPMRGDSTAYDQGEAVAGSSLEGEQNLIADDHGLVLWAATGSAVERPLQIQMPF